MAATHIQTVTGTAATSGTTASATYGSNITAGSLLVASVKRRTAGAAGGIAVVNVNDSVGNKWKQAAEGTYSAAGFSNHLGGVDIWYCDAPAAGNKPVVTATVQGFPAGAVDGLRVTVTEYGTGGVNYEAVETTGYAVCDGTSGTATTRDSCSANDLLVSICGFNGSAATVPSTWTSRASDTSIDYAVADLLDSGTAGTKSAAWTSLTGNTNGYILIVAFKPGGIRTSTQPRCLQTQYRLEAIPVTYTAPPALGTATSPAFASPTVGNTLFCVVSPYNDCKVTALTDDHGNTWRELAFPGNDTVGENQSALWMAQACTGAATTITLTATMENGDQTLSNISLWLLLEYANIPANQYVLTEGANLMSTGEYTTTPQVTTGDALDGQERVVLAYINGEFDSFAGLVPDAGWHSRWSDSNGSNGFIEKVVTSSAAQTAGWTHSLTQGSTLFVVALGPAQTLAADYPEVLVEWLPDENPTVVEGGWSNITGYVVAAKTGKGRTYETDQFETGTLELTLRTPTRLFDPGWSSGPYFGKLLPMKQIRVTATWSARTFVFRGYVTDWGNTTPADRFFETTITAKDGFVWLERTELPSSAYAIEVQNDTPTSWFRLSEKEPLYRVTDSGSNPSIGVYQNTEPTEGLASGDSSGAQSFSHSFGDRVVIQNPNLITGYPFTISLLFQIGPENPASLKTLFAGTIVPGYQPYTWGGIWIRLAGQTLVVQLAELGGNKITFAAATNLDDLAVHQVVFVAEASNSFHTYVDGTEQGYIFTYSGTGQPAFYGTCVNGYTIGNLDDLTGPDPTFGDYGFGEADLYQTLTQAKPVLLRRGTIDEVAVWDGTAVPAARAATHYDAMTGWVDDDTGARVEHFLDAIGWPLPLREISTGIALLQGSAWSEGDTALSVLQKWADTETGAFFMDGAGRLVWRNRHYPYLNSRAVTSQATYGDAHAATTLRYVDVDLAYDDAMIRNPVNASRRNGTNVTVRDQTAIDKYGLLPWTAPESEASNDNAVRDRALYYLSRFKDPTYRLKSMTFRPQKNPSGLWPEVLGRQLGDRITVKRTPLGSGNEITSTQIIERIEHEFSPRYWQTTFVGSPTDPGVNTYLIEDDATYGKLDTAKLAY